MTLKTNQELKDSGYVYIATNQTGLEVWAKFSGCEDTVQYIDQKEGIYTSSIQTISFGKLCMFEMMLKTLNFKQFFNKILRLKTYGLMMVTRRCISNEMYSMRSRMF